MPFTSVSKPTSSGNEFDLLDNERAGKTHFHMKGCAPGLVLKQMKRQLGNGQISIFRFLFYGFSFMQKHCYMKGFVPAGFASGLVPAKQRENPNRKWPIYLLPVLRP